MTNITHHNKNKIIAVSHRPCHQLSSAALRWRMKSLMMCRLVGVMSPAQQCRSWDLVSVSTPNTTLLTWTCCWLWSAPFWSSSWPISSSVSFHHFWTCEWSLSLRLNLTRMDWCSCFIQCNVSTFTGVAVFKVHCSVFNFHYGEYFSKMNITFNFNCYGSS